MVLSNDRIKDKIIHIEKLYTSIHNAVTYPVLIALVYIVVLPYFMWVIEEIVKKSTQLRKENIINNLIFDSKGKQKLAIEESKLQNIVSEYKEKEELNQKIELLDKKLSQKDDVINDLKQDIESYKTTLSKYLEDQFNFIDELEPSEKKEYEGQYELFKNSEMYNEFKDVGLMIREVGGFPSQINDLIREKFIFNEIIESRVSKDGKASYYDFTKKGYFFWKEFVLNAEGKDLIDKFTGIP
ncbi:hypothetical protein [Tenacibaculum sp. 190524A05c]|uniref:hypothetical protein n=1 Tax=Tenacibaculum platacis TaxID=3137852 RepID=UPI0032B17888